MTQYAGSNRYCPVYIALDVSDSMQEVRPGERESAHDCLQLLIADLVLTLQARVVIGTSTWLSLIAFSTEPHLVLPLTPMRRPFPVDPLPRSGQTDLAALLTLLENTVREDRITHAAQGRFSRPLVFVVTDGQPFVGSAPQPMSAWLATRDRLTAGAEGARIAALGLEGADETVLWKLATGHGDERNAFVAEPGQPVRTLAENVAQEIARSIAASVTARELVIAAPPGMRRVGT